jgi:hypothetical protein
VRCGELLLAAVPEVGIPALKDSRQIIIERLDSDQNLEDERGALYVHRICRKTIARSVP